MKKWSISVAVVVVLGGALFFLSREQSGEHGHGTLVAGEAETRSAGGSGGTASSPGAGTGNEPSAGRQTGLGATSQVDAEARGPRAGQSALAAGTAAGSEQPIQDGGAAADNQQPSGTESMTPQERRVLAVYTSLVDLFGDRTLTCKTIGEKMERLVDKQQSAFADFRKAQQGLSEEERADAHKRLSSEENGRMAEIRQSLRQGLARCGSEERVRDSVRRIAEIGHAS